MSGPNTPKMLPKPARKASVSMRDAAAIAKAAQTAAMPPPPDPVPAQGILEAEMSALSPCLRSAMVKAGQVNRFYADTRRLGIHNHTPHPPRSLTSSLGREIEKYDQLCDAMEIHLHRAIAVLQRDLRREEERLKAETTAAAKDAAPIIADTSLLTASPPSISQKPYITSTDISTDTSSAAQTSKTLVSTPARRQSTVSLSSLQRPPFPHKLDLSSQSLRLNPDEILTSGLSSPVTLAPKSSHRQMSQDLMVAALNDTANMPVDIDLTVGDAEMNLQQAAGAHAGANLDTGLGSSADKPIELDLDMDMNMFNVGDNGTGADVGQFFDHSSNFIAGNGQDPRLSSDVKPKEEEDIFLDAISGEHLGNSGHSGDIFASLDTSLHNQNNPSAGVGHSQQLNTNLVNGTPSPASLLASFGAPSSNSTAQSVQHNFDFNSLDFSSINSAIFTAPSLDGSELGDPFKLESGNT